MTSQQEGKPHMELRYSEIPTEEQLSLERREKHWDSDKFKEFNEENFEEVERYLIDNGFDDRIAAILEKYPVDFYSTADTLSNEEKRATAIQLYRESLTDDLCYLIFLLKSGPVERLRLSQGGLEFQKALFSAYLTRLEIVLEDSSFVRYMGFDLDTLLAKHHRLKRQVEERKHKRAGESKILATALDSLVLQLNEYGYDSEYQQAQFLYELFHTFEIHGFRKNNRDEAIDKIRKWKSLTYPA